MENRDLLNGFEKATNLLRTDGWCKWVRDSHIPGNRFCALGALDAAKLGAYNSNVGISILVRFIDWDDTPFEGKYRYHGIGFADNYQTLANIPTKPSEHDMASYIANWNNAPETTKEDVVETFERVVECLKQKVAEEE